jgi:hypothetical protein
MSEETPRAQTNFDRVLGTIHDLPDTRNTKPSAVTTVMPILGYAQTYIVRTYRRPEGFTIFLETVDADGRARLVIPPKVAAAIYRQRSTLTDTSTPASRKRDRTRRDRARLKKAREERRAALQAKLREPRS